MKVLILVMSTEVGDYPILEKKQRETWDSITRLDVDTVYYYAGDRTERQGTRLIIDCQEGQGTFYNKTMMAFRELLRSDEWDYIFKTDNSAYIDKAELIRALRDKPRTEYYGGHLYQTIYSGSDPFLWGEGMALSRDVVEFLVTNYNKSTMLRSGVEDVHIGMLLKDLFSWDLTLRIHEFYNTPLVTNHAYRCKNDKGRNDTEDILKAMDNIHTYFHPPKEFSDDKKR